MSEQLLREKSETIRQLRVQLAHTQWELDQLRSTPSMVALDRLHKCALRIMEREGTVCDEVDCPHCEFLLAYKDVQSCLVEMERKE